MQHKRLEIPSVKYQLLIKFGLKGLLKVYENLLDLVNSSIAVSVGLDTSWVRDKGQELGKRNLVGWDLYTHSRSGPHLLHPLPEARSRALTLIETITEHKAPPAETLIHVEDEDRRS